MITKVEVATVRVGVGLGPFYVSGRVGVPRGSGRALGYLIALPIVVGYFALKLLVLAVAWLLKQPRNVQLSVLAGVAVIMVIGAIANALHPVAGTPSPAPSYGYTVPTASPATIAPTLAPVDSAESARIQHGKAVTPHTAVPPARPVAVVAAPHTAVIPTLPPAPVVAEASTTRAAKPLSHSHSLAGSKVVPTTPTTSPTTSKPLPDGENGGNSMPTTAEEPSGA